MSKKNQPLPRETKKFSEEVKDQIASDKSTVAAFGVLFILPTIIILFALAFLFPYMMNTMGREEDPSGTIINAGPNQLPQKK